MRWSLPVLCVCAAALPGCGGGEDEPARTVRATGDQTLRVKAEEYRFDPGRIVVTGARGPLRFTLDNTGDLAHNLTVFDGDRELGGVRSFPAGEKRSFEVRVPPGSYRFVCTVADHDDLGMTGELEVRRR